MLIRLLFIVMVVFSSCTEERTTICFTGDLLLDRGVRKEIERRGLDSLFISVADLLKSSDYVVANLECPATKIDAPVFKKYIFRAEPEWLPMLKQAGITHLVLANNHAIDQGRSGLVSTVENCRKHELIPIGYNETYSSSCDPLLLHQGKKNRVAVFSSVPIPLENWIPLDKEPSVCQSSPEDMAKNIREFKRIHPEFRIIAVLHWGIEFRNEPEMIQRKQARMLIDAGADAVIGHHPHVVQSIEMYKDKPVFYSLGNFIFDQSMTEAKRGVLVKLNWSDAELDGIDLIPYQIKRCSPMLMSEEQRKEFKEDLLKISRGVKLEEKGMGWELKEGD